MKKNNLDHIERYEFSVNQKHLWNIGRDNIDEFYNQIVLDVDKSIASKDLKEAIRLVIDKNETLVFNTYEEQESIFPAQILSESGSKEIEFYTASIDGDEDNEVFNAAEEQLNYPYDHSSNTPIRFCLVEKRNKEKCLIIRLYSLWGDRFSSIYFCNELHKAITNSEIYKEEVREVVEYKNFSAWQNQLLEEPEEEAVNFWKNYKYTLGEAILPFANTENTVFRPERKVINSIDGAKYEELKRKCFNNDTLPEDFLLSRFIAYLSKFTENEITFGYVPYKRSYEALDHTFGLVSKTFPIKIGNTENVSEQEVISQLRKSINEVEVWSDYFYLNRIKADVSKDIEMFNYSFEFIDVSKELQKTNTLNSIKIKDTYSIVDLFDLKVNCIDYGNKLSLELYYDKSKYEDQDLEVILAQMRLSFDFDVKIDATSLIPLEEEIITRSNDTVTKLTATESVLEMFKKQAQVSPDDIAVIYEEKQITYLELDKRSDQFANFLRVKKQITKGEPICVLLDRSEWFVITILGILKSGAYYVPIDLSYPEERIKFILEDCDSRFLISESSTSQKDYFSDIDIIAPSDNTIYETEVTEEYPVIQQDDLAYCIYTSGSTGTPKGCLINHSNLSNYVKWANSFYFDNIDSGNWGCITSVSFDLTITSLFTSLTRGKKLWIGSEKKDVNQLLKESFNNPHIDTLKLTPAHLSVVRELKIEQTSIKTIICGGEQLHKNQLDFLWDLNNDMKIYNEYGPTEATVGCIVKEITKEDSKILIGKPIANTKVHILNKEGNPCQIGMVGEIMISGEGLSSGYLNRPELTQQRFVSNDHFAEGKKYYKTGDFGRWLSDGNIEYIGRQDDQVKIRGYRIELGEIEKQLLSKEDINNVTLLVTHATTGEKELTAYIVADNEQNILELRQYLSEKLPDYMIPLYFIQLDKLPLTINGKIDKKHLAELGVKEISLGQSYVAPRNEIEKKLVGIWEEVLQKEKIGVKNDFFEIGGHSLKATRLINEYYKVFDVKLGLKELFDNLTLESHAKLISHSIKFKYEEIKKIPLAESYPISDAQRRLWILSQFQGSQGIYNMPSRMRLSAGYDILSFKKAIYAVIERHEILRTVFKEDDNGEVRQWILSTEELDFNIDFQDFREESSPEDKVNKYIKDDSYKPFDLENGPLLRVSFLQVSDDEYVIYHNINHIIGDAWSMGVLEKDLLTYYEAYTLGIEADIPELKIQYKDYATWQISQLQTDTFEAHKDFWLEKLSGELPLLDLPSEKIRPKVKTYRGHELVSYLSTKNTARLRSYCQDQGGSLFMGLVTIWNILFYKYTSQEDIIIGTPAAGRDHPDLVDQIGFYVNALPLRNKVNGKLSFKEFFNKVTESTLTSFENGMYPFDRLVEGLDLYRDTSRHTIFDILLDFHENKIITNNELSDENQDKIIDKGYGNAKFDLQFDFIDLGENISIQVNYNRDVYDQKTVEQFINHFKGLTSVILENLDAPIHTIEFLSTKEKVHQIENHNQTKREYPSDLTVIDLFKEQVRKTPNQIAVVFENKEFTYQEIDNLSNQLAHCLKEDHDITTNDLVGIKLDRSEWVIISILSILKLGAAYIPIDPNYPQSKQDYIISESGIKLLVTDTNYLFDVSDAAQSIFAIDVEFEKDKYSTNDINHILSNTDLAYVIYTSGSTGKPKGVMIEHSSLSNYLHWGLEYYVENNLSTADFGLFTSLSFDLTISSLFFPIVSGGKLRIFNEAEEVSGILKEYFESDLTCIKLTPAHINILEYLNLDHTNIELAIVGGDTLHLSQVNILRKLNPSIKIYNEYGPTEFTIGCIVKEVKSAIKSEINIGQPIANTSVYILNSNHTIVPYGAVGEICLAGKGLARGYMNQEDLTKEKFIENPYKKGETLYRTGDLGKWLSNGDIGFEGRKDNQIKIRGYRIELGEIEYQLLSKEDINEVVVTTRESNQQTKEIVAYLVSSQEQNIQSLRTYLSDRLPQYMIPVHFVQLDKLPLTSNGKIDKKSLPDPDGKGISKGVEYIAPRNHTEQQLVAIWEKFLNVERIGIRDNFFHIGGDSIIGVRIVSEIQRILEVKIDMTTLFNEPSIEALSDEIANQLWHNENLQENEVMDKMTI
jgi:amino acid adenylation domain-containing protein